MIKTDSPALLFVMLCQTITWTAKDIQFALIQNSFKLEILRLRGKRQKTYRFFLLLREVETNLILLISVCCSLHREGLRDDNALQMSYCCFVFGLNCQYGNARLGWRYWLHFCWRENRCLPKLGRLLIIIDMTDSSDGYFLNSSISFFKCIKWCKTIVVIQPRLTMRNHLNLTVTVLIIIINTSLILHIFLW